MSFSSSSSTSVNNQLSYWCSTIYVEEFPISERHSKTLSKSCLTSSSFLGLSDILSKKVSIISKMFAVLTATDINQFNTYLATLCTSA